MTASDAEQQDLVRFLAGWWESFADDECRGYSPLYDAICRAVARDDRVLRLAAEAPAFGRQPNVLLAAVHFLLLGGVEAGGELTAAYDGAPADDLDVGRAFCDFVLRHPDEVAEVLATRRTNTNECGRAAVLVPALRWAATQVGEPLCVLDAGASAGLNLNLDRYRIDYGAAGTAGPAESTVVIRSELSGDAPISGVPAISARCGLDRAPVDLQVPDEARWQLACVWPDTGRLERTRAAIAIAQREADRPVVVRGDVVDDLERVVAEHLSGRDALCVVTTWVVAYLRVPDRERFAAGLAALSTDRDVVWISAEPPDVVTSLGPAPDERAEDGTRASVLGGIVYARGVQRSSTILGACHPHGRWLRWSAPA